MKEINVLHPIEIAVIIGGIICCAIGTVFLICSVFSMGILSFGGGFIAEQYYNYNPILSDNTYEGYFQEYKVRMEETTTKQYYQTDSVLMEPIVIVFGSMFDIKRKNVKKIIHLTSVNETVKPYALTGHDYGSGNFDRVFIVEHPNDGYSSSTRNKWFGWKFEPCPHDEGRIKPFTSKQIADAILTLNEAVKFVKKFPDDAKYLE